MKPNCNEVLEEIYLLLDGELSAERCVELKAHLDLCSACYGRVETERLFKELLRARCGCDAAPPDLVARIRISIRVESTGLE